jgi:glycosyltransferase involved in cell wall biosynthesis
MKIALVNDVAYQYATGDPAAVGGSERYQWLLARGLAEHGWSPIVGVRFALEPGRRVPIDGVEFIGIGRGQYFRALYRFLSVERPDWCFWFGSTHRLGPAVLIGRLTGTKSLFAAQHDLQMRPREALSERERFWPLYAMGLSWSSKIFLQHRGQYAELPSRWRHKAYVIPGVVQAPERSAPHAERDPYVAWVGVLREHKRPDLLIEIARKSPGIKFVVCGGASLCRTPAGYSERAINELEGLPNVTYLGHVAPARAIDVIGHAAMLLSTSDSEGFPSVFVEAWAHGTPVISLKIDPDQVIARHGLGINSDGVEMAVQDIHTLLQSVTQREAIARRAREYVARTHSGPAVAAMVEQSLRAKSAPVLQPFESVARS